MSRRGDMLVNGLIGLLVVIALTLGAFRIRDWLFHPSVSPIGTARIKDWRRFTQSGAWLGSPNAKLGLVMFSDFQCPYCRAAATNLEAIQRSHPDIAVLYRHFPLSSHPSAMAAARASVCAARQGAFRRMHDELFLHQDSLGLKSWASYAFAAGVTDTVKFDRCLLDRTVSDEIRRDSVAGKELGVTGTPTILIRELRIDGSPTPKELETYVAEALRVVAAGDH